MLERKFFRQSRSKIKNTIEISCQKNDTNVIFVDMRLEVCQARSLSICIYVLVVVGCATSKRIGSAAHGVVQQSENVYTESG